MERRRVALIGCGAIGTVIARSIDDGIVPARLVAVMDVVPEAAERLADALHTKPRIARSLTALLRGADMVVEAANQDAVRRYAGPVLSAGRDLVVMSTGALLDKGLRIRLLRAAKRGNSTIHLPSGAIGGIDAIGALRLVGITGVTLTVRKPPEGLAAYLKDHRMDSQALTAPTTLYEGGVEEAVKLFPANVNVAATLALASDAEVKVRVIADPSLKVNVHEIEVASNASTLKLRFENMPHPDNPKTSYLAGLAAIRLLQRIAHERLSVGT